jgi:hypothetical protein
VCQKSRHAILSQLEQEESAEAANRISRCSQSSIAVDLQPAVALSENHLKHGSF